MKRLAILVAVGAFLFYAAPVLAKGATQIKDCSQVPHPYSYTDCSFDFWNGNGIMSKYSPISYHDVITPSGNENEMFTGVIANDTGHDVVYSAFSGSPIPAGATCYSFVTQHQTDNWLLTIDALGNFSLECHFK